MQVRELNYPSSGVVPYLNVQTRASWGAILVGAVVAVACFIVLGTLGMGIGLMAAPAADAPESLGKGLGIGAAAWYLISSVLSFFVGGWFAGRLTGIGRISESVLHGIASWGVVTVAIAFLTVFTAGKAISGALGMLGQSFASGVGGAAAGTSQNLDLRDAPGALKEKVSGIKESMQGMKQEAKKEGISVDKSDLRDAPAPLEEGSRAAGVAGLGAFLIMFLQAASAGFGARSGTRVLRPLSETHHRVRA